MLVIDLRDCGHRSVLFFFFFQAEDGIRDLTVTGVQTCALPIYIVDGRDGGHRRHWPRGHTTRGGTHGSGGLLARGASAVPCGEAVEVRDRPAVATRSQDSARHSRRARVAAVRARRASGHAARRARELPAHPRPRGAVLGAHSLSGATPGARVSREL